MKNIDFENLKNLSKNELISLGMRNWDDKIWLFPGSWYDLVPDGFVVACIDESFYVWSKDICDNDTRAGALAYGIIPEFTKHEDEDLIK